MVVDIDEVRLRRLLRDHRPIPEGTSSIEVLLSSGKESLITPHHLITELAFPLAALRMHMSSEYRCAGLTRGTGEHIFAIPGLVAGDWEFTFFKRWGSRMNYEVHTPGIASNLFSTEKILETMEREIIDETDRSGKKVLLFGHSLGGMQAIILLHLLPDVRERVEAVITLGSPISYPFGVNPLFEAMIIPIYVTNLVMGRISMTEDTEYLKILTNPIPGGIPVYSIFSLSDPVVDWHSCLRPDVYPIEVGGGHCELILNPKTLRWISLIANPETRPEVTKDSVEKTTVEILLRKENQTTLRKRLHAA